MSDLQKMIDELYCLYNDVKNEVRRKDKRFFERWKAGGFIIDEDILSMYPCLSVFVDEEEPDKDEEV